MIRNFALTFAAVTLRLWIPIFLTSGLSFEAAYPVIAWLSWVPNLLVAEVLAQSSPGSMGGKGEAPGRRPPRRSAVEPSWPADP